MRIEEDIPWTTISWINREVAGNYIFHFIPEKGILSFVFLNPTGSH